MGVGGYLKFREIYKESGAGVEDCGWLVFAGTEITRKICIQ